MSFVQDVLNEHGDPRRIGGVYWSGYWQQSYTVLRIFASLGRTLNYIVQWDDGVTTEHCTAWDKRGDRVVYDPAEDPVYYY